VHEPGLLQRLRDFVASQREFLLLGFMLEFLHGAIWLDFGSPLSRSFILIHFGLFLIWQPVWRGDQKLSWYSGILFLLLTPVFVAAMSWGLIFGWLIILFGFCAGRLASSERERLVYLLVMIFLAVQIFVPISNGLFNLGIESRVVDALGVSLPWMPLIAALVPVQTTRRGVPAVDFVHAIASTMLIALLMAGSLLTMYLSKVEYPVAIFQTVLTIGVLLLAIAWLLAPRAGFSGLAQLWQRSVLSIGTPLEQFLADVALLFQQCNSPRDFLEQTMMELSSLPWVTGAEWQAPGTAGTAGNKGPYDNDFTLEPLQLRIYTRQPLGGALYFHCKLLVNLIHEFYLAKLREHELTKQTHLQAIYETGARVTHDIKNLLQSLQAITTIVNSDQPGNESLSHALLRRQLPQFAQRLQLALDKLSAPETGKSEQVYLKDWWQDLRARANRPNVDFQSDVLGDPLVPPELFDSVIDNLLENVREKAQLQPGITAMVTLFGDSTGVRLTVCDTGSAVPPDKAQLLLREPMLSDSGLGIGLYQAARQAEGLRYTLALANNQDGRVCFELSGAAGSTAAP
jgi:signal transduction histidine kinase